MRGQRGRYLLLCLLLLGHLGLVMPSTKDDSSSWAVALRTLPFPSPGTPPSLFSLESADVTALLLQPWVPAEFLRCPKPAHTLLTSPLVSKRP